MTLTEIALQARKIIAIIAALIVVYVMYLMLKPVAIGAWAYIFPDKELPNVLYGQLPPLEFVEKSISNSKTPIYELNTKDGKLPGNLPNKMVVYPSAPNPFSYSAGKNAQAHADILGFTDEELITDLKGDKYRWRDNETNAVLEIDINSRILTLNTPLSNKKELYTPGTMDENRAKELALNKLNSIGRFYDKLYKEGTQKVTLAKIQGNVLIPTSTYDAEMARVDYFRKINEYPVFGPDPTRGLINVTVRRPGKEYRVLDHPFIEYSEWEIVSTTGENRATYPIIPVAAAWNAVSRENKGVIVSVSPKDSSVFSIYSPVQIDKILVNNIYLAYYDTPAQQKYIQPIYVFEGSYNRGNSAGGNIVLYFPAISGQYIDSVE